MHTVSIMWTQNSAKKYFDVVCHPLLKVIKTSIYTACFLEVLILSTIAQIWKVKNSKKANAFRSINLLPTWKYFGNSCSSTNC